MLTNLYWVRTQDDGVVER